MVFRGLGECSRRLARNSAFFLACPSTVLTYSLFSVSSKNNDDDDDDRASSKSNDLVSGEVGLVSGFR